MGECEQHPHCAPAGEGVCPACLQKKLTHVWRGESHLDTVLADSELSTSTTYQVPTVDPVLPKEALAIIGSIASIAKRTQHSKQLSGHITEFGASMDHSRYEYNAKPFRKSHPSFDVRDGEGDTFGNSKPFAAPRKQSIQDIEGVMKDWTALHAKRRSSQGRKKSVIIADESPMVEYSRAGLPLVDRIAKETALRVIQEVGDDAVSVEDFLEDLSSANRQSEDNIWEDNVGPKNVKQQEKGTFDLSPVHWHSKLRSKWVKGLGSPLNNSSKVFPSKSVENGQKSQALGSPARNDSRLKNPRVKKSVDQRKALRFNLEPTVIPTAQVVYDSGFTSETVIEGMPEEILKPEDMNQRLRTSYNTVLSWLQDLPSPHTPLFQQIGEPEEDPSLPSSLMVEPRHNDLYGEDLTLVGHLHEIAEEHEDIESSEEEVSTTNHFNEVSSFGKFLIRAAQRQPREGLSRVASAIPGR